jgi:hypothetical protein
MLKSQEKHLTHKYFYAIITTLSTIKKGKKMYNDSVVFTSHAVKRLKERFNMIIESHREYYIGNSFVKSNYPYIHHNSNLLVENWFNEEHKVVLVVECKSRVVITVMPDGNHFDHTIEFERKMERQYA